MRESEAINIGSRVAVYVSLQLGIARDRLSGEWGIVTYLPEGGITFLADKEQAERGLAILRRFYPFVDEDREASAIQVLSEAESEAVLIAAKRG